VANTKMTTQRAHKEAANLWDKTPLNTESNHESNKVRTCCACAAAAAAATRPASLFHLSTTTHLPESQASALRKINGQVSPSGEQVQKQRRRQAAKHRDLKHAMGQGTRRTRHTPAAVALVDDATNRLGLLRERKPENQTRKNLQARHKAQR
jgi:hypothetical protein